jgi:ankyrin repeat protein
MINSANETPLQISKTKNRTHENLAIQILLQHRSNFSLFNPRSLYYLVVNNQVIHYAERGETMSFSKAIDKHGELIDSTFAGKDGKTALEIAIQNGYAEFTEIFLIRLQVELGQLTSSGITFKDLAMSIPSIVPVIKFHGIKKKFIVNSWFDLLDAFEIMIEAIIKGDANTVERTLRDYPEFATNSGPLNFTLFEMVCMCCMNTSAQSDFPKCVDLLLQHNPNFNAVNPTTNLAALHFAVIFGEKDVVKRLLE